MDKVFVVHVYDPADHLHDYYVHATLEGASRQAVIDVVAGRFPSSAPDFLEDERVRVSRNIFAEPGVHRRHLRCDGWRAHIDEMQVHE